MRVSLFSFAFFSLLILAGEAGVGQLAMVGTIHGERFVNLRSGPDLSHPSKEILREGQEVKVEKEVGSWYFVSLADGRSGYVHKSLVQISGKVKAEAAPMQPKQLIPAPTEEKRENLPKPPAPELAAQVRKGQPLPVIKVLEGKEWEVMGWLGVALCIFILGWVCGGNYYLRRDRVKRSKVHF